MIYRYATVVARTPESVRVEVAQQSNCAGCAGGSGCGIGPILALFGRHDPVQFEVSIPAGRTVKIGSRIKIGVPGRRLLQMAGLAYVLPLLGMVMGAWLASLLSQGDSAAAIGSVAGLLLSVGGLRMFNANSLSALYID